MVKMGVNRDTGEREKHTSIHELICLFLDSEEVVKYCLIVVEEDFGEGLVLRGVLV